METRHSAIVLAVFGIGLLLAGCFRPDVEWVPAEVAIYDAQVTDVTTNAASVFWRTNTKTASYVVVIHQESYSNTIYQPDPVTAHRVPIRGLTPDTWYMLLVQSSNGLGGGAFETGARLTFHTTATP